MPDPFQAVLYDQKWLKLRRISKLWRHIPFVDFVLGAGSMALGNVKPSSDFDVIVAAREGRIFTVRLFSVFVFGLRGVRRKGADHGEAARDKICLNHFITRSAYKLSPPHSPYWQNLYAHLVPVWGDKKKANDFFEANAGWTGKPLTFREDLRFIESLKSIFARSVERILAGTFGDAIESILRRMQTRRIKLGLPQTAQYKPRIRVSNTELEFHPHTQRIEELELNNF